MQSKPLIAKVVMSTLTIALTSVAVIGNASVLGIIARFKSLRTVPNLLLANVALVDLLNAVINMPIHLIYTVLEAGWYRGQSLAIMTIFLNRLFTTLNMASMLVLMGAMYFAITFDLKYLTWRTTKKAVVTSCLTYLVVSVLVVCSCIPLVRVDLGDVLVREYRAKIIKEERPVVATVMVVFIIFTALLGFLTTLSIKIKRRKVISCICN